MPHVSILWGLTPEPGTAAIKYEFPTQAELDAFLLGVSSMEGWAGHKQVPDGYVLAECLKCSDADDAREFQNGLCSGCQED